MFNFVGCHSGIVLLRHQHWQHIGNTYLVAMMTHDGNACHGQKGVSPCPHASYGPCLQPPWLQVIVVQAIQEV